MQPTILVRNTTAKPVAAHINLAWRGDSKKGTATLGDLRLAPFETRRIQVGPEQKRLGIPDDAYWGLVAISSASSPDDLMAIATSYDNTGHYGAETPFSDNLGGHFAGGEWIADATHNALIVVTNGGSTSTQGLVTLHYDGGTKKYEMQQAIPPKGQMWVNLGDLVHNRIPDRNGNVLPAGAISGTYELHELHAGPGANLMVSSLQPENGIGEQNHPPLPTCCGFPSYTISFVPDPAEFYFGQTELVNVDGTDSCEGSRIDISDLFDSWWSGNTSVATVSNQQVHAVGFGSTTLYAEGDVYEGQGTNCYWVDAIPVDVAEVANLTCGSVTRGSSATCTVTPSGLTVTKWQFKDGSGNIVTRTTNVGSLSWTGIVVTGGTVSATIAGITAPLNANLTVNQRSNFTFAAVNPTQSSGNSITCYNGDSETLPSPPVNTSRVGASCADLAFSFVSSAPISDNGPNNSYQYVTSVSSTNGGQPTQFPFIVVSDLLTIATFYNSQCGTYSSTNSTGFIAGTQLKQNVFDHEQGSVLSHWTEYRDAQNNSSNNIGVVLEAIVGPPGMSQTT